MIRITPKRSVCAALVSLCAAAALPAVAGPIRTQAAVSGSIAGPALLPTGQYITGLVAPGSSFQRFSTGLRADGSADAAGAMTTALSPDGTRLLVLTSGYNANFNTTAGPLPGGAPSISATYLDPLTGKPSTVTTSAFNWVFVYNVAGGIVPQKIQQIQLPDTFAGISWNPNGTKFYVSGGQDDRVYAYGQAGGAYIPVTPFVILGHNSNGTAPKPDYDGGIGSTTAAGKSAGGVAHGLSFGAETAGVAVSADGSTLYAANLQNDSISIIDAATQKVRSEFRLYKTGNVTPNGEYPFWITPHAVAGGAATDKIYVSSIRDGQVIAISTTGAEKIITLGGEPGKMLLNRDGSRLYVANPDLDEIDEIATAGDTLLRRISVQRSGYHYRGAIPNSLAITPNGATIYTTLGGENAVGVIDVASGTVRGRIPTGWFPNSVTISPDGTKLYIVNTKSNAGPNPSNGKTTPGGVAEDPSFINQ